MNILIISSNAKPITSDFSFNVLQNLKTYGNVVKIITKFCSEKHEDLISFNVRPDSKFRLYGRRLKIIMSGIFRRPQINNKFCFQDIYEIVTFNKSKSIINKIGFKPDIIFLHFNDNFINAKNLYQFCKITGAPIFILLIDMAQMTGGCHYAWDCEGYKNECGHCPALYSTKESDLSRRNLFFRKKYYDKTNIHIIAGSEWQYNQIRKSTILKDKPVSKVLTSFNPAIYKPANREAVREKLGIPGNKFIIFFGAASITEERKGFRFLLNALTVLEKNISPDRILLLIAGDTDKDCLRMLRFSHKYLGYLKEDELISAFQASDVFACPSIEDSGPTMINQSLLCGTPVVSFKMGVALDLIEQGENGFMADLGDSLGFAGYLEQLINLDLHNLAEISGKARETGLEKCNPEQQILKYLNLFEKSIKNE